MYLFHGTLLRHLPSIETDGLVPQIGAFTERVYGRNATGVIPAVFMADDSGLERVVHAMVAAIMDEITEQDFDEYDIGPEFHLNDDLFFKYGALLVMQEAETFMQAGKPKPGIEEPEQAEDGDWYSLETVRPVKCLTGEDFLDFLSVRGLTPSAINDFVDPESVPFVENTSAPRV